MSSMHAKKAATAPTTAIRLMSSFIQREGVEMIAPRRTALLASAPGEDVDGRELDEAEEIH